MPKVFGWVPGYWDILKKIYLCWFLSREWSCLNPTTVLVGENSTYLKTGKARKKACNNEPRTTFGPGVGWAIMSHWVEE